MSGLFSKSKIVTESDSYPLQDEKTRKTEEKKYFRFFQNHRIEKSFLEQKRDEWFIRNGESSSYPDLIWALSHELLHEYGKSDNFFNMKMLYFEMAFLLKNRNEDFFHLLQESKRMELYDIKKNFAGDPESKVMIICGETDCTACSKLNGLTLTIDEALERMPIPPKKCSHNDGWCTCCYIIGSKS